MKALRVVGTVVAVVALAATGLGTFLAPSAFALGLGTGGMLTLGTYAGLAAGVIGMASAVLAPKPGFSGAGSPLNFQTNPQSGLPYPIGRTRMSGVRIHAETYDATAFKSEGKQDVLAFGVLLGAGGPMQEIETFRADKMTVAFDGSGQATGDNANYMAQKVSLGTAGASALTLSFGGAGFPGWTSAHKLSGIAHALWDLRYDEKGNHFGAGVPEPEWIGKWAKVYDPRKDSTYPGGSGSHRALNEATYEWSNNPALHALTWCLGRWQNGKRTLGIGAPVSTIRVADFVEAANVADANLWACGGVEWSTDTKWSTLKRMLQAGGAEPTMTGAMIGCRVNTPRVSIATVEAADLLDSLSISASKSRRERFNTVIPRFRSEMHEWEIVSGTPVTVPDYVTIDGGQRTKEIDFALVQMEGNGTGQQQPGQLAAYEIVNSREAGPIRFTTGPKFFGIKTGDCITLNVPDEGLDAQPVIVRSVSRDPATMKFTFEVETETEDKHDFALGASSDPPPTWEPTPPDIAPPTPSGLLWSLEDAYSDDGHPGILIIGACEFPGADSVLLDYRKVGDPDWITIGKVDAAQAVRQLISPLDGDTSFEARVAYQSDNRFSPWLVLSSVTTPPSKLSSIDDGATRNVSRGAWAGGVAYEIGDLVTYDGSSYQVITAHTSAGGSPPPNANVVLLAQAGANVETIWLYKRSTTYSAPAVPDNDITYTFETATLGGSLDGWSRTEPSVTDGPYLWETFAHARSNDATTTIAPSSWLNPAQLARNDDYRAETSLISTGVAADPDGNVLPGRLPIDTQLYLKTNATILLSDTIDTAGVTVAVVSPPPGATVTINTAAGVPVAGKPKGFIRVSALPSGTTPTTISVKATKDGIDYPASFKIEKLIAADPVRSQMVRLYKRTATNVAPALIDNNVTYTFADDSLTGSMDGWSQTEPPVTDGPYLWETYFFATAQADTLVIAPGDWLATPNLLRIDDYRASTDATAFTVPAEADGTVDPGYLTALEGQLYFRTSTSVLVGPSNDTAGVTLSLVSAGGGTATINTANNTPVSGKPKGYFRISALAAGLGQTSVVFKATYGGIDYPTLPVVVTKALAGQEAYGLRLIPSRDRLTRDAWGRPSPASQTFTFTPERENFTAGTVTFEVRNAANVVIGGAPTYGTVSGGNFVMTDAQVIAAAGATRGIIVFMTDTGGGGKYAAAQVWTDGTLPAGDNEWPDPQLNTLDAYFAGGALTAPFSIQTNGAAANYKYNNYLRIVSTTTPTNEYFGKVFEKLPVRFAGETFYWGYTGGRGVGSGALGGGIYLIFRDIDGNQVGTTQKLFNTTAMTPTGDWPQVNGTPINAPADAAYVEGGYYRNAHGTITSSQYQIVNAYLSRSQPNSNNTEEHLAFNKGPAEQQEVPTTVGGTIKSYPTTLNFYRYQGNTDVTTAAAWAVVASSGITASIGAATGVVTISGLTKYGYIDVTSTHNNLNRTTRIYFIPAYDPEPQALGTISADNPGSSQATVSSTSYSGANIGPFVVKAGPTGYIVFQAKIVATPSGAGSGGVDMKARYRTPPGSGTWIDSGMIVTAPAVTFSADNPVQSGSGATLALGGLSPNTDYEVQFEAKMTSGSTAASMKLLGGTRGWGQGL